MKKLLWVGLGVLAALALGVVLWSGGTGTGEGAPQAPGEIAPEATAPPPAASAPASPDPGIVATPPAEGHPGLLAPPPREVDPGLVQPPPEDARGGPGAAAAPRSQSVGSPGLSR